MWKKIIGLLILLILLYQFVFTKTSNEKQDEILKENSIKAGKKILITGKKMIDNKIIIKGSCWDFINKVYENSGYPREKRGTVFKTSKKAKKYASIDLIQPGDWLYYINHSYHNVEHSGIFVRWIDKKNKKAEILSYAGQNLNNPGRYKIYLLDSVYTIIRPKVLKTEIKDKKIKNNQKNKNNTEENLTKQNNFGHKLCPPDLILHQNLRAPILSRGERYVRNYRYNSYTRGIVKEAHILQKHLNRLGFNAGPIDGIIGPKTKSAILKLQRYLKTIPDGYVGPKTRKLLNHSC